jgi:hypothetical protein
MDLDGIIGRIAESKIKEAIDEGKFDNLPGKGKPIVFDDDPVTPPHLRLANRILKNANVLPEWLQLQKDVATEEEEVAALRARLIREHRRRTAALAGAPPSHIASRQFAEWHAQSRSAYLRRLKIINTAILKMCLVAPSTYQPPAPRKIDVEMAAFDVDFPAPAVPVRVDAEQEGGTLKALARARYEGGAGGGSVRDWRPDGRRARTAAMTDRDDEDQQRPGSDAGSR